MSQPWWSDAVFYQIYPRSFFDASGDGVGDLRGVISKLDYIAELGVTALWLSPFYPSPQVDAGYDVSDYCDVDPLFGSLDDFKELLNAAHARNIRVTIDIVPNHCSNLHPWFQAAVAAGRGSAERARFHFVDGRGENGELPPTNWTSVFGGPSWTRVSEPEGTPGQWYYHLFAAEQPDFNWDNPEVLQEFIRVFRFWLDLGVDGFRIDVSDALIKDTNWRDTDGGWPIIPKDDSSGVHEIYRALRRVMDEYDGDRMAVIETGADDHTVALFLRPDEMHLAFNFSFVKAQWRADSFRQAIDNALAANALVGAHTTWVTDNHDTPRSVSRYSSDVSLDGIYIPAVSSDQASVTEQGKQRVTALASLLLSLPGAAYIYNGQELGLPNVDDLPEEVLQDPLFARTQGEIRGRDGCRIPMPWDQSLNCGFSAAATTWLPIPPTYSQYSVSTQSSMSDSMLMNYKTLLALRSQYPAMRRGTVEWVETQENCLDIRRAYEGSETMRCLVNFNNSAVAAPTVTPLWSSTAIVDGQLAGNSAVLWLEN